MDRYRSPLWLPGGNAQTIWPALFAQRPDGAALAFRRERWHTPDADFVDADWLGEDLNAPLLVMFHGLEGSTRSHYAQAFADWARRHGWRFVLPHFRGCSGELNLAPRAYHSGDFEEIGWMLAQAKARHAGPLVAVALNLLIGDRLGKRGTTVLACGAIGLAFLAAVRAVVTLAGQPEGERAIVD